MLYHSTSKVHIIQCYVHYAMLIFIVMDINLLLITSLYQTTQAFSMGTQPAHKADTISNRGKSVQEGADTIVQCRVVPL